MSISFYPIPVSPCALAASPVTSASATPARIPVSLTTPAASTSSVSSSTSTSSATFEISIKAVVESRFLPLTITCPSSITGSGLKERIKNKYPLIPAVEMILHYCGTLVKDDELIPFHVWESGHHFMLFRKKGT